MTEAELEIQDRNARVVADAVFRLATRFRKTHHMTPVAVLEGAIRGGALAMALIDGDTPAEIADALEEAAEAMRQLPDNAFEERPN